jgi:phosphoserine aminotransferase
MFGENFMTERIFNFSAGPAVLPLPVLEEAQRELVSLPGVGMSVMEISHRSKTFDEIIGRAESGVRELLGLPENYHVLFLQGGASLQFSMIPMNLLPRGGSADYIVTGSWGKKAVKEAKREGAVNIAATMADGGFTRETCRSWRTLPRTSSRTPSPPNAMRSSTPGRRRTWGRAASRSSSSATTS